MSEDIKKIFKEGKVETIIDFFIAQYVPQDYHINLDLSGFPKAMREYQYFKDGKYHFEFALKAMFKKPLEESLSEFISGLKYEESKKNITTECLDEFLSKLYHWYIEGLVENLFNNILVKDFDGIYIKSKESVFSLLTYIFKSPALSDEYNFEKTDIRRQLFHRLEAFTLSTFHRFKNFENHFKENFLDMIKLNYSIKEIIEHLIIMEEVNIRRNFVTEIYFNIEHFFSVIIKEFNIEIVDARSKQSLLNHILEHFNIDEKIELGTKFSKMFERLNENNENFKSLFEGMRNTKTTYLEINNRLINRRNSLHSNGFIGGKIEAPLGIGKIKYKKIEKFAAIKTMGITDLVVLMFIAIECCEKIISETVSSHQGIIVDRYMEEIEELKNSQNKFI